MKIAEIKKSLQESIESGDEPLLQILYATAAAYKKQHERDNAYELTEWQRNELDRRLEANEPTIPWEIVKQQIKASKKEK